MLLFNAKGLLSVMLSLPFKNISCYCLTFLRFSISCFLDSFKNISCYCLTLPIELISMVVEKFKNISCYCLTAWEWMQMRRKIDLKTSHVIV